MFLQKRGSGSWFLAKKTGGNIEYLENVGDDPDSWLQNEIIKAVALMNPGRIDDLRKIQKKRNPVLVPTKSNCHVEHITLASVTEQNFPFGLPDIIITDPPYGQDYLAVYDVLACKSKELLKDGGSLVAMVGQSYLPSIMGKLSAHLTYQWTVAYLTPGGQSAQLWAKKVNTFWKPLLWFAKGQYRGRWIGDVVKSAVNDNDKRFHKWGQSESGMADIVKRFTRRGDIVCDPFMGAGTTGKVCLDLGRRFVGFDHDIAAYKQACSRLGVPIG